MMSYDKADKVLFSADGFGKFGALDAQEDWDCEARRYYFNIVGKFGPQVQAVLKEGRRSGHSDHLPAPRPGAEGRSGALSGKIPALEQLRCGIRGRVHRLRLPAQQYRRSSPEAGKNCWRRGAAPRWCSPIWPGTATPLKPWRTPSAMEKDRPVLPPATTPVSCPAWRIFLNHLKGKAWQKRTVALVESSSWAPTAARTMVSLLDNMKDITIPSKHRHHPRRTQGE